MLGKIVVEGAEEPEFYDPNNENLVAKVSCSEIEHHGHGISAMISVFEALLKLKNLLLIS